MKMKAAFVIALISLVTRTLCAPYENPNENDKFDRVLDIIEILEAHEAAIELIGMLEYEGLLEELLKEIEYMIDTSEFEKHGQINSKCLGNALKNFVKCVAPRGHIYDIYACSDFTLPNFQECFSQPEKEGTSSSPTYTPAFSSSMFPNPN